jgi:Fe-S-cluster containining protein
VTTAQLRGREYLNFSCTGCGNCCRDTIVLITDADVRRIMEGTGKPAREIVRFFSNVEMPQRDSLWIRFGGARRAAMALRWENRHCAFLGDDNRCQIYEHRPVTCRSHPFELKLSDTGALIKLGISGVAKCPHEWEGSHSIRSLKATEKWNTDQVEAFEAKVKAWNRRRSGKRTGDEFLRFCALA